jgi:hypothetical protein
MTFNLHATLNPDRIQSTAELGENSGFYIACGAAVAGIAREVQQHRCPFCRQPAVYSAVKVGDVGLTKSQGRIMMPMLASGWCAHQS